MDKVKRKEIPIFKQLEEKSNFFCPCKWDELFLYLNHGNSNSCHHPIPHKIPSELLSDPFVLHNTPHKLKMQQLMLDGHRPQECHMCWHIEDLDEYVVSDRLNKSLQWADDIENIKLDPHHIPKFIEVVFDNTCNLMCSYCDPGQSSTWSTNVKNGPLLLKSDHRKLYANSADYLMNENSPYHDAWMNWWPQIEHSVEVLKFSGGEPLLSQQCWRFLDQVNNKNDIAFSINSNFSVKPKLIERLASRAEYFKRVVAGVSVDAVGDIAEYSRQNLDFTLLMKNMEYWCSQTPENCKLYLQSTVNNLSVWGITDMFDLNIKLRNEFPDRVQDFYSTIVRFPEFQSVSILPKHLKIQLVDKIQNWLDLNRNNVTEKEKSLITKLIVYLTNDPESLYNLSMDQLVLDFKKFVDYYDSTSSKKFKDVYPKDFVHWFNSIQ